MPRSARSSIRHEPAAGADRPAASARNPGRTGAGLAPGRARDAILVAHRPLVRATARRFARNGIPFEDLESEGFVGLLEAARRFDPSRGTTFGTYASFWVRVFVERYAMSNRRIVATPQTRAIRRISQIRRVERRLEQASGERVDSDAIASAVRLKPGQVEEARTLMSRGDVRTRGTSADGYEPRSPDPTPEEQAAEREWGVARVVLARRALQSLDGRERLIIENRLLREDRETLEALGERLGITRERVRQIEAKALVKMRESLAADHAA